MSIKLSKAPVFYVLAQVKFNALMQLAKFIPDIQERFRQLGFPDYMEEQQLQVNFQHVQQGDAPPQVSHTATPRYSFMNLDRTEGYLLFQDNLIYHTTHYTTSADFIEKTRAGLEIIHGIVNLAFMSRLGLRFLDVITCKENEKFDKYLKPGVLGYADMIASEGANLQHSLSEVFLNLGDTSLLCKVMRGAVTNSPPFIPAELAPIHLTNKAEFQHLNGAIAVLDTDIFYAPSVNTAFDIDATCLRISDMKAKIQIIFENMITVEAIEEWR